ncbi:MAG: Stp1/IreP family PP2C-type Ser/Thr phosphatase [Clostridiales bacterium]|nr:Stp1/IreP family PP2C-type Ser/Thr phosphatase [Candidatus Coliplasma equi]
MKYSGKTDVGAKRTNNQDSFAVFSKDNYCCAIVCDGMGGAKGGNVASSLGVKTFASVVKKAFSATDPDSFTENQIRAPITKAVNEANTVIYNRASGDEELEGMGTTIVAVINCLCGTFAVNVGDSRVYRQTENSFKQVSTDHSFVQYLINKGEITPSEALMHPNRNIILRALGVNESVECDIFRIDVFEKILLCTDGLTNHVSDARISEIISGAYAAGGRLPSYKARTEKLIDEANENGGSDNITAVLLGNE